MHSIPARPAPKVTAAHVRTLLGSSVEHPVLYISYGEGTESELDVWSAEQVFEADIVITRATAVDLLGGEAPDGETVTAFLQGAQQAVDQMISVKDL
ncbi:hypothetical protein [Streptacidiphilus carbonis]|uniref:hypothetical protein n=1 Tax=Streptacidiphilus carbonis TaxID=105422 RepID=UPI0005A6B795|nr:hypothetical protein [Streptacidiphilus carbonis]